MCFNIVSNKLKYPWTMPHNRAIQSWINYQSITSNDCVYSLQGITISLQVNVIQGHEVGEWSNN
jgi:hypothetical protein